MILINSKTIFPLFLLSSFSVFAVKNFEAKLSLYHEQSLKGEIKSGIKYFKFLQKNQESSYEADDLDVIIASVALPVISAPRLLEPYYNLIKFYICAGEFLDKEQKYHRYFFQAEKIASKVYKESKNVQSDLLLSKTLYFAWKKNLEILEFESTENYKDRSSYLEKAAELDNPKAILFHSFLLSISNPQYQTKFEDYLSKFIKEKPLEKCHKKFLLEFANMGNGEAQYKLGLIFTKQDKTEEAQAYLLEAANKNHRDASPALWSLYRKERNQKEALKWLHKTGILYNIPLEHTEPEILFRLAGEKEKEGDINRALELYDVAARSPEQFKDRKLLEAFIKTPEEFSRINHPDVAPYVLSSEFDHEMTNLENNNPFTLYILAALESQENLQESKFLTLLKIMSKNGENYIKGNKFYGPYSNQNLKNLALSYRASYYLHVLYKKLNLNKEFLGSFKRGGADSVVHSFKYHIFYGIMNFLNREKSRNLYTERVWAADIMYTLTLLEGGKINKELKEINYLIQDHYLTKELIEKQKRMENIQSLEKKATESIEDALEYLELNKDQEIYKENRKAIFNKHYLGLKQKSEYIELNFSEKILLEKLKKLSPFREKAVEEMNLLVEKKLFQTTD